MGSLMAGWDSHVSDPNSIKLERNRSMTKDEIATYWRSKKNIEDVHGVLKPCHTFPMGDQISEIETIYRRSNSLPIPITKEDSLIETEEENKENLFMKHGWWTKSRWAFLNEPPVIASETPQRYASQFHVAREHTKESNNQAGIRA